MIGFQQNMTSHNATHSLSWLDSHCPLLLFCRLSRMHIDMEKHGEKKKMEGAFVLMTERCCIEDIEKLRGLRKWCSNWCMGCLVQCQHTEVRLGSESQGRLIPQQKNTKRVENRCCNIFKRKTGTPDYLYTQQGAVLADDANFKIYGFGQWPGSHFPYC